jgi:hypothetical protein
MTATPVETVYPLRGWPDERITSCTSGGAVDGPPGPAAERWSVTGPAPAAAASASRSAGSVGVSHE